MSQYVYSSVGLLILSVVN